jgi:hypothetical protein
MVRVYLRSDNLLDFSIVCDKLQSRNLISNQIGEWIDLLSTRDMMIYLHGIARMWKVDGCRGPLYGIWFFDLARTHI